MDQNQKELSKYTNFNDTNQQMNFYNQFSNDLHLDFVHAKGLLQDFIGEIF